MMVTRSMTNNMLKQESFNMSAFKMGECIGTGSFSKVYLAKSAEYDHAVAMKVMDEETTPGWFYREFARREIRIMTGLLHPNIIKCLGSRIQESKVFIFMELAELGDLKELVLKEGILPVVQAQLFFRQLTDAVHYLHSRHIAHRDIKLQNIFLMSDTLMKLGDFGFAREHVDKEDGLTRERMICGSLEYMAPEALSLRPLLSKPLDMWAMGVVLHKMVMGASPFYSYTTSTLITEQKSAAVRNRTSFWAADKGALRDLILKLLESNIANRLTIQGVKSHAWVVEDIA